MKTAGIKQVITVVTVSLLFGVTAVSAVAATVEQNVATLKATGSCIGCDLTGADLSNFNITTISGSAKNLSTAVLSGAKLNNAILSGANFADTTMIGTNLTGANINGVSFLRAKLNNAILTGASMNIGTIFSVAVLTGVKPPSSWNMANLSGATWIDGVKKCKTPSQGVCN